MIDSGFWKGKRVFLTGHTGFKGSWLALWLLDMGAVVQGYSLEPPTNPSLFEVLKLKSSLDSRISDIRDRVALTKAITEFQPDVVFHLAAQPLVRESYLYPVETFETNVMGTVNLLDSIRSCESVRSVVVITTDKCYENKEWVWGYRENEAMGGYDPYSSSKGCSELVISSYRRSFFNPVEYGIKHSVSIASARAGNVIGGGDWAKDRLIPDILSAVMEPKPVIIRSPNAIRPWQHVLEPLSGYLLLAQRLYQDGVIFADAWNFGPNDSDAKSVEWIVKKMCGLWKDNRGYVIDSNPQPHEASYLKLDCSKARQILGWNPVWNLETSLKKIVEWAEHYRIGSNMENISKTQIFKFITDSKNLQDVAV